MMSVIGHLLILVGLTNFLAMLPGFVIVLLFPPHMRTLVGALSDGVFTLLAGHYLLLLLGVQPGLLLPVLSCPFPVIYYFNNRYGQPPSKLVAYLVGLWGCWALL